MNSTKAPDVECDVLVVGAGPAGTAAAITLHRAGHRVLVVDKATFPRDKCCGDGLTTLALRELESLGFDPRRVADWFDVDAAWLRSPSGREVRLPLPSEGRYAAVAPRLQLDHALVEHARDIGVEVRAGHGFGGIETGAGGLVGVAVDGIGTVRLGFGIGAGGMWSPVGKAIGATIDGYRGEWHAFRQYAANVTG